MYLHASVTDFVEDYVQSISQLDTPVKSKSHESHSNSKVRYTNATNLVFN